MTLKCQSNCKINGKQKQIKAVREACGKTYIKIDFIIYIIFIKQKGIKKKVKKYKKRENKNERKKTRTKTRITRI